MELCICYPCVQAELSKPAFEKCSQESNPAEMALRLQAEMFNLTCQWSPVLKMVRISSGTAPACSLGTASYKATQIIAVLAPKFEGTNYSTALADCSVHYP